MPPPPPLNVLFVPGLFGTALSMDPDPALAKARLWPSFIHIGANYFPANLSVEKELYGVGLFDDFPIADWLPVRAYREGFRGLLATIGYAVAPRKVAAHVALMDWRLSPLQNSRIMLRDFINGAFMGLPVGAGIPLNQRFAYQPVAPDVEPMAPGELLLIGHSMGGLVVLDFVQRFLNADQTIQNTDKTWKVTNCVCVGAPIGGSIQAASNMLTGKNAVWLQHQAAQALARSKSFEGPWSLSPRELDQLFECDFKMPGVTTPIKNPKSLEALVAAVQVDP